MKSSLRTLVRSRLRAMPKEQVDDEARRVVEHLLGSPEWHGARTIFSYVSIGHELPTRTVIECAWEQGKRVTVPRVLGEPGRMEAVAFGSYDELATGYRNLLEPTGTTVLGPSELDLVVTPGLGFDRSCRRLGQGGGFYDRFLAALRVDAHAVGLAFSVQLLDDVPIEPHDRVLDAVVTPDGIHRRVR